MKIERFDLDANGKQCSEGYYAHDGRCVILMPPTGEMADGVRLATREEVDAAGGRIIAAEVRHIANCEAKPSGDGD